MSRFTLIAVTGIVITMTCQTAHAQSLFNSRAASPSSSPATRTGSLFSNNTGFPRAGKVNETSQTGGSFVGRSNQGFVGGGSRGQSPTGVATGSEGSNRSRRFETTSRSTGAPRPTDVTTSDSHPRDTPANRRHATFVPRHRIAFEFTAREPAAIRRQLQQQLTNVSARHPDFAGITVLLESDGIVKLQGHVPTDATRQLAGLLVRLEPGVRGVHNQLAIVGQPQ